MEAIVVLCTCPTSEAATRIADALVEERLAACVNVMPGLRSTYRWEGEVHRDDEMLLVIKTVRARFEEVRARILSLHPYELPEVIAVEVTAGHAPYLDWIASSTTNRA
jgi:periplasmic divalent cation tolerance protein